MNPYTRLIERCSRWSVKVRGPKTVKMYCIPDAANHGTGYSFREIYQRTYAADQLDFDVRIRCKDDDLILEYVERPGPPPNEIL